MIVDDLSAHPVLHGKVTLDCQVGVRCADGPGYQPRPRCRCCPVLAGSACGLGGVVYVGNWVGAAGSLVGACVLLVTSCAHVFS